MNNLLVLLCGFLDNLEQLAAVVGGDGRLVFANKPAMAAVEALGTDWHQAEPWRRSLELARDLPLQGHEVRAIVEDATRVRWAVRVWPMEGSHVAILARRSRDISPARLLTETLHVEPAEARLALQIAEGRSNSSIATLLGASPGAIKSRIYSLYRKAGVRNRAQLVALVARLLSADGGGV